jgi:nicotinamidase-related amidase
LRERRFLETIEEILSPEHTVFVIIDMQNDFCSAEGGFAVRGADVAACSALGDRISDLLRQVRDLEVPRMFIVNRPLSSFGEESSVQRRFNRRLSPQGEDWSYTVEGSWGAEIIPALSPRVDEPVIKKRRSSAFWGTHFDMYLRAHGFRTVVLCGVTTEGCVESTARDAMFNEYHVVIVSDAVASLSREQHDAAMILMRRRFDVLRGDEVVGIWRKASSRRRRVPPRGREADCRS